MKATVIIGFADALAAPEVAWSLLDGGFTVVGFGRKGKGSALRWSRRVRLFEITPPEVDIRQSIRDLRNGIAAVARKTDGSPLAVMPLDDAALWLCSKIDLNGMAVLVGPTGEAALLAVDKNQQIRVAQKAGFHVPPTEYVECAKDVRSQKIPFPVVLKSANAFRDENGRLGRRYSWICSDPDELKSAVADWAEREPMLLQQYISGRGEGLFGLATEEGVIAWTAHRRLRMMNPHGSGSCACTIGVVDESVKAASERFLNQCSWRGLFMVETLRDEQGNIWFMEFNGRPWGSMALARRLGFEYPAWSVQLALARNTKIFVPSPPPEPIICRHLGREFLHLLFVARGPRSRAVRGWPSVGTALREVMHLSRNDRWYNWRADDCGVFFADFCHTLHDNLAKRRSR